MDTHFLKITIQEKGSDDYRAFLDFADRETMMVYQIRGYGGTPGDAANDVWVRYKDDPWYEVTDSWPWE